MTILMFLYEHATLPTRSTDLYTLFICLTVCRHLAKSGILLEEEVTDLTGLPQPYNDIIKQFSKFAFKALNKNQLIFSLAEIKEHCPAITDHPNGLGLLHAVEYVGLMSKSRSFNFVHFSVQEFLAAYYITIVTPDKEYSILEDYFWSDILYNTFNFYTALTSGQHPSFKRFLRDEITIDDIFREDKLQRLRFYRIFQEAGDNSTCEIIEGTFTDKKVSLLSTTLSPNNLEDLAKLLTCSSCRNWKELDLNGCHIQDYGLRLLHQNLHHTDITIEELRLANNDLTSSSDSSLSEIIITCKVKWLDIGNNRSVGETPHFTTMLAHSSCPIERLDMYHNNYSSTQWAMELFSSLKENKTVQELDISATNISDDVCGVICEMLPVNKTLKDLWIYSNPITVQASRLILDALKDNHTIEKLWLPHYPEDVTMEITSLQQAINDKRRRQGCDIKLEIEFGTF
ncbi:leucine-rich repeat-containing protein 45-like [Dysidea avara]|uniref:leucine-rich repeat-containing protein 45-like n=1 Tax=Dysidea avara TaxID=196820 RepID=UPI0033322CC4